MKTPRGLLLPLLTLIGTWSAFAAPVPHPDRPARLIETRDGFSVEYSPGQEAWMERGFTELRAAAEKPAAAATVAGPDETARRGPKTRRTGPVLPGSAQYLLENRNVILARIAQQIGRDRPSELQGRVYDTFLGYYRMTAETMYALPDELPASLSPRHLSIWERSELIRHLREGNTIPNVTYDPETDTGQVELAFNTRGKSSIADRLAEIRAEIDAQQLDHSISRDKDSFSASVTLGKGAAPKRAPIEEPMGDETLPDLVTVVGGLVVPIVYRSETTPEPTPETFSAVHVSITTIREIVRQQAAAYRDATSVGIILHETAEVGLVGGTIGSRDRRWLCDGTANYVMWRVARDLMGEDFARQVFDLDAELHKYAAQQPKINLAAWPATERKDQSKRDVTLNRAHYIFATRAMFLLTERHGENALAQLWADVARTPKKKVSAKTFAAAYRKRFKGNLTKLIAEAQSTPIPVAPVRAPAQIPSPSKPDA